MDKVSVIILNYNGKNLLPGVLNSIKRLDFQKRNVEVIVVDNASEDGSQELIKKKFSSAILIQNKKNCGTGGINSAIPKAKGDFLFFLNNDCELEKNCLNELLKAINSDKSIAACGVRELDFKNKSLTLSSGTWLSRSFYGGYKQSEKGMQEIPYTGAVFIRKAVLRQLGYLFDPDYFLYSEDIDLGMRIRLLGLKTVYVPKAVIFDMEGATTKRIGEKKKIFLMERNLITTFLKTCSAKNIFLLAPYVFGMRILAMLKDISGMKFGNMLARLRAILWILMHLGFVMKKRKETQKLRKISDKFLFKVFSERQLFGRS